MYDFAAGDKGLAAIESVGAKAALELAVNEAKAAYAISDEIALATKGVVLDAVQTLVTEKVLASLPSTVGAAQTAVLAAITELSSDPKVNSMAEALLSDAKDFISNATLNFNTANQSSISANGSTPSSAKNSLKSLNASSHTAGKAYNTVHERRPAENKLK